MTVERIMLVLCSGFENLASPWCTTDWKAIRRGVGVASIRYAFVFGVRFRVIFVAEFDINERLVGFLDF